MLKVMLCFHLAFCTPRLIVCDEVIKLCTLDRYKVCEQISADSCPPKIPLFPVDVDSRANR